MSFGDLLRRAVCRRVGHDFASPIGVFLDPWRQARLRPQRCLRCRATRIEITHFEISRYPAVTNLIGEVMSAPAPESKGPVQ